MRNARYTGDAVPKHLLPPEFQYSFTDIYRSLNTDMRKVVQVGCNTESKAQLIDAWSPFVAAMSDGMEKIPAEGPRTLYRGCIGNLSKILSRYKLGQICSFSCFTSCTTDLHKAYILACCVHDRVDDDDLFVFRFKCKSAVSISKFSIFPYENEFILRPNVQFTAGGSSIVDHKSVGALCVVDLTEIDRTLGTAVDF